MSNLKESANLFVSANRAIIKGRKKEKNADKKENRNSRFVFDTEKVAIIGSPIKTKTAGKSFSPFINMSLKLNHPGISSGLVNCVSARTHK